MSKSIPEGWLLYKPYGAVIEGTNIIAFKVPLKHEICQNIPVEEWFTPQILMQKIPNIKCIVDLTNTPRYYQPQEFTARGIEYVKIMIPGKQVPPIDGVHKFFDAMRTFNSIVKNDELIGVHCTHGINRTGYLICRYLMHQLGWEPEKSVQAFDKARGYSIHRQEYVNALMNANADAQPNNESWSSRPRRHRMKPGPMDPPHSGSLRRGYADDRHYPLPPPQLYGYAGPSPAHAFRGRPSPIPPPPPPPPGRFYGPRSQPDGMPYGRFQPRMVGPPHMSGLSRFPTPPSGPLYRSPGGRMPPSKVLVHGMPPPRLPRGGNPLPQHQPQGMPFSMSEAHGSRKLDQRTVSGNQHRTIQRSARGATMPNDLDFTVDTFEENLTTTIHQ